MPVSHVFVSSYYRITQHEHIHLSAQEAIERLLRLADDGLILIE